ncbi:hypothetical protein CCH79_00009491, partial [Gambusia affinis]
MDSFPSNIWKDSRKGEEEELYRKWLMMSWTNLLLTNEQNPAEPMSSTGFDSVTVLLPDGNFGVHICIRTAPEFTSTEPRPLFVGGPEFAVLVCIRVQLHIQTIPSGFIVAGSPLYQRGNKPAGTRLILASHPGLIQSTPNVWTSRVRLLVCLLSQKQGRQMRETKSQSA